MNILGISAFYHDSAACLVQDGRIVAAAQEERFTRKKHDFRFPKRATAFCLKTGGITAADLDYVVFYDKPFVKFERLLETYMAFAPRGLGSFMKAMPLWLGEKLWIPSVIEKNLGVDKPVLFTEHHEAHAASAYYPSPFTEAAVLTIDGVGEWSTSSFGTGRGRELTLLAETRFPHSLGLLYSAFTYFTGFKVNSGEYKVMGLAPYGEPRYVDVIRENLIDLHDDGSFSLNMEYFDYCAGLRMTNDAFARLFGGPPRAPESPLTQREMDLARSVQEVTEEAVLRMARHVRHETGLPNLCMAGGVALNCVANGKLLRERVFDKIWLQPAAGDAGGALGAALAVWHGFLGNDLPEKIGRDTQSASLLGSSYSNAEIAELARDYGWIADKLEDAALFTEAARLLADGAVIGWFQGRMEFGPRALGGRSILGDARNVEMQKKMNLKIKHRESFRPFAPSVLVEDVAEWFDLDEESPYMLIVADVRREHRKPMTAEQHALFGIDKLNVPRSDIPAVTHVDYSARVQTVAEADNPRYYKLIKAFKALTGCGVIVNTSFNVRGEPIVESPQDAYRCFMRTEMDYLVIENHLFTKGEQPVFENTTDWQQEYELD